MGKDVRMSWANELIPPRLSPKTLAAELRSAWISYRRYSLPMRDRLVFLCLRILQRLAYNAGWYPESSSEEK